MFKLLIYTASSHMRVDDLGPPRVDLGENTLQAFLQITFGAAAAVALIMIAIASFQYVISAGAPDKTKKAKDTIMYALIGLVVSISAFTIVTFVMGRV